VAQVAVCSQINTKHINTVCEEPTIVECYTFWCITQPVDFKRLKMSCTTLNSFMCNHDIELNLKTKKLVSSESTGLDSWSLYLYPSCVFLIISKQTSAFYLEICYDHLFLKSSFLYQSPSPLYLIRHYSSSKFETTPNCSDKLTLKSSSKFVYL